jgi:hypothetical protein
MPSKKLSSCVSLKGVEDYKIRKKKKNEQAIAF